MKFIFNAVVLSSIAAVIFGVSSANVIAAPDPGNAESATQTAQYNSPLKDYRPLGDDKRAPWKAANDEVAKIGGWRVYAREAATASSPASASAIKPLAPSAAPSVSPNLAVEKIEKPMTIPMPDRHAGHGKPQ